MKPDRFGKSRRQYLSMRKVVGLLAVSVALLAVAPTQAEERIKAQRVRFEPGTSGATVDGRITGSEIVDYLLGARAGQTMTVTMTTGHGATYFNVLPPDSDVEAVFIGTTGGNRFEGRLDLDGDWKLRVFMMRSAARRGEIAEFRLEVGISGSPDPTAAREANDFGPREWDARGDLGCASNGGAIRPAACPFKVIRTGSGGTVFVVEPTGQGTRILYFERGEWSSDSAADVSVRRRDDVWTVTVGSETYEIPDAVLDGG